ncbi:MAG: lipid-A-disaccharide synthase [Muribaculaceae bacterium]|nr:lipid-A-disaccharide synthase [Muribaculaceae bacterium]
MRYFISAGEASGDIHAAGLIKALRQYDPQARFTFLGGDLMSQAAGNTPLIHYRDMAYMGFSEVLRNLSKVLGNLKRAKQTITSECPDAVILIDYPSFNLKIARHAWQHSIPVYYYISPKVWAWKEYRVKDIRKYVTRLFSILPFEKDFYLRHNYEITYVGNPSVEEIENRAKSIPERSSFLDSHNLPDRPILALVPGSRRGEIRNNLPVMLDVAKRFPMYNPVIAGAPGIERSIYDRYGNMPVVTGVTFELIKHADIALVTSGTATLEAALLRTPQVVCYRANGSRFSYNLFKHILKVKYVSLPNLIADSPIVPEMLLHHCNADEVSRKVSDILPGTQGRSDMLNGYSLMRKALGDSNAASSTAQGIIKDLNNRLQR